MDEFQIELFELPEDPLDLVLIKAKNLLFEGDWSLLEDSFRLRLARKPLNRKLFERIESDLMRIRRLRAKGY